MMDEKDKKIIDLLKRNSRMKNVEIAKILGLTEGAVRNRIKNLVKKGIIKKFTIDTDNRFISAIIFLDVPGDTKPFISKLMEMDYVDKIYEVSGTFDIVLFVFAFNLDDLNEKIDKIREMGVKSSSFIILKEWL